MNNFEKIQQNNEELRRVIEREVKEKIEKYGIDGDKLSVIAEKLKRERIPAGDELNEKSFSTYREQLVNEELEKRAEN